MQSSENPLFRKVAIFLALVIPLLAACSQRSEKNSLPAPVLLPTIPTAQATSTPDNTPMPQTQPTQPPLDQCAPVDVKLARVEDGYGRTNFFPPGNYIARTESSLLELADPKVAAGIIVKRDNSWPTEFVIGGYPDEVFKCTDVFSPAGQAIWDRLTAPKH